MKKRNSKGLSPVIATVLLVAMVVVIALIVFLWFKGIQEETVTKFGGENVKLVCDDVHFEASYNNNNLYVSNSGNVPIFELKIKVQGDGSYSTQNLRDASSSWPEMGLNQGGAFSDALIFEGTEIVLIPVLLGDTDKGRKTYVCNEDQHGVVVSI